MATKKTGTAPAAPRYDAGAQYRVELAQRIELFGQAHYPGHDLTLRGDVLEGIEPAAVQSATLVTGQD